ncbi:hypothetical protein [Bradyrhizobium sp. ORS 375]|uniref:hypothetical protein n=1 Tax=Bradyrhizobium sp. (strain ORS 375) TaxID=566679 RepID=UPI0006960E82|nr:hypothetical protein [Bradyrhizobium sp. ORS 375]
MKVFLALALGALLLLVNSQFSGSSYAETGPSNAAPSASQSEPQVSNPAPPAEARTSAEQRAPTAYLTFKTPYEFWLTALTIIVLIVMGAMLCLMAYTGTLTPEFYKAFLILIVVFASLFLIVAGYTDQQTAPVFSLLGTIAGYIFGRMSNSPDGRPNADVVPGPPRATFQGNGQTEAVAADQSQANTRRVTMGSPAADEFPR